jgi:glycosyltransferase involved in cell wall biosynthesis
LIEDGVNGFIYKDGDIDDLYQKVKYLLDNDIKRRLLAKNAYQTMESEWNSDVAAERLIKLIESGFDGNLFTSGPCSKAKIIKG